MFAEHQQLAIGGFALLRFGGGATRNNRHKNFCGSKLFWSQNLVLPIFSGNKETRKHSFQEISGKCWDSPGIAPGQSREDCVYVCFLLVGSFAALKVW